MASKYRYGVAQDGLRGWRTESYYDRMTQAPVIIQIFAGRDEAQAWIDAALAAQPDPIPGGPQYPIYGVYDLNTESAYLSRQNIGRNGSAVVYRGKAELVRSLGR